MSTKRFKDAARNFRRVYKEFNLMEHPVILIQNKGDWTRIVFEFNGDEHRRRSRVNYPVIKDDATMFVHDGITFRYLPALV